MFSVIGNVYRGQGFTWVLPDGHLLRDLWKYSKHGIFETLEEATQVSNELNKKLQEKEQHNEQ